MAYVNVAEWKTEQVCEWLKGLDNSVLPYVHSFMNHGVNGQQLLGLRPEDLEHLGVLKLGHQEIILEAVEYLRNFHYELDRENLQLLALRLSCQAHSLHNELSRQTDSKPVTTQTLSDVASVMTAVKPLVRWLDRPPFSGQLEYNDKKAELMKLALEMATCAQRDRFAEKPIEEIRTTCGQLAKLADYIIQDIVDPMILQPASLDLATLKKKPGDDLGFCILPSFHGAHQIAEIKFGSAAHQCGKMEEGDEIVQVNYQTVVGWERKNVLELFRESPAEILLTLKRRPRHTKVYGQIYIKPYRLPSNKKTPYTTRWQHNLPSPRPELLTIPDFTMPPPRHIPKNPSPEPASILDTVNMLDTMATDSSDSDSEVEQPLSIRLYSAKPRNPVQRRATITGASPTAKHGIDIEQFWKELKEEHNTTFQLRDKAASCAHGLDNVPSNMRPQTCLGIEQTKRKKKGLEGQTDDKKVQFQEKCNEETKLPETSSENLTVNDENANDSILSSSDCNNSIDVTTPNVYKSVGRERGKLDKSHSTPAYDLTESDDGEDRKLTLLENVVGNVARKVSNIEKQLRKESNDIENNASNQSNNECIVQNDVNAYDENDTRDNESATKEFADNSGATRESSEDRSESISSYIEGNCSSGSEADATVKKVPPVPQIRTANHPEAQPCRYLELPRVESVKRLESKSPLTPPEPPPRKYYPKAEAINTNVGSTSISKLTENQEKLQISGKPNIRKDSKKFDFFPESSRISMETHDKNDSFDSFTERIGFIDDPEDQNMIDRQSKEEKYEPFAEKYNKQDSYSRNVDSPDGLSCSKQTQLEFKPKATEKDKSFEKGVVNRAMMVARSIGLHGGLSKSTSNSPKSGRKRNALLAKKRNVSVKDVGAGELDGWLTYRSRGAGGAWARAWFVLKCSSLYRFKTQDSMKADCLIALTGFTVSQAPEVKSRRYAFKVYHTGTVFYFAADTEDCLVLWLDAINKATLGADSQNRDSGLFSETDDESDAEQKCKPKAPETPDTKTNSDKPFGSLKKGTRKDSGFKDHEISGASLDRKYLRFLGAKNQNVPVPTAQFRSYRRVLPASTPKKQEFGSNSPDLQMTIAGSTFYGLSASQSATDMTNSDQEMADYRRAAERNKRTDDLQGFITLEEFMLSQQEEEQRQAASNRSISPRGHTPLTGDHVHVQHRNFNEGIVFNEQTSNGTAACSKTRSNDELTNSTVYGHSRSNHELNYIHKGKPQNDSVLRQTKPREFAYRRNGVSEQKHSNAAVYRNKSDIIRSHVGAHVYTHGTQLSNDHETRYSGSSGDLSCQVTSETLQRAKKDAVSVSRKGSFNLTNRRSSRQSVSDRHWLDSLKRDKKHEVSGTRLKNVAQYQPPPIPTSPFEQEGMRAAFEMHLDKNEQVQKANRLKSLFGTKCHQKPCTLDLPKDSQKTLLGSPRLHRALFRDKGSARSGSQSPGDSGIGQSSSSFSGNSPSQTLSQSFSSVSSVSDWSPDSSTPCACTCSCANASKCGANHPCSKGYNGSTRNNLSPPTLPYVPPPTSPPPDYPGLEYPPVFEPGTYSLSDASLLRNRNKNNQNPVR